MIIRIKRRLFNIPMLISQTVCEDCQ